MHTYTCSNTEELDIKMMYGDTEELAIRMRHGNTVEPDPDMGGDIDAFNSVRRIDGEPDLNMGGETEALNPDPRRPPSPT
jgi:hypothetical protein